MDHPIIIVEGRSAASAIETAYRNRADMLYTCLMMGDNGQMSPANVGADINRRMATGLHDRIIFVPNSDAEGITRFRDVLTVLVQQYDHVLGVVYLALIPLFVKKLYGEFGLRSHMENPIYTVDSARLRPDFTGITQVGSHKAVLGLCTVSNVWIRRVIAEATLINGDWENWDEVHHHELLPMPLLQDRQLMRQQLPPQITPDQLIRSVVAPAVREKYTYELHSTLDGFNQTQRKLIWLVHEADPADPVKVATLNAAMLDVAGHLQNNPRRYVKKLTNAEAPLQCLINQNCSGVPDEFNRYWSVMVNPLLKALLPPAGEYYGVAQNSIGPVKYEPFHYPPTFPIALSTGLARSGPNPMAMYPARDVAEQTLERVTDPDHVFLLNGRWKRISLEQADGTLATFVNAQEYMDHQFEEASDIFRRHHGQDRYLRWWEEQLETWLHDVDNAILKADDSADDDY